jgi:hypothetical protein
MKKTVVREVLMQHGDIQLTMQIKEIHEHDGLLSITVLSPYPEELKKPLGLFHEVDTEILKQWQAARKKKRAAELSRIVYNAMTREANLAGITLEQAVTVCIERSWITFVADWYKKTLKPMKGHGVISDEKFNDWLNGGTNGQLT